ncbi:MAG: GTP 3',8-cyclase MoaA [Clostridia bacterium]|nr:GTP 3',8-cyclase MoaA [Clostridia bacterium]
MIDHLGRRIEYLRISVTQNCNLNCLYCQPGGTHGASGCASLSAEEIETAVKALARLGIRKVRITGGEPLVRKDIFDIVRRLAAIRQIEDLSMTTNGISLASSACKLKDLGLHRVNISLDSLDTDKFAYITGGGKLERVLQGVHKALEAGLSPVRINTVVVKGLNDSEIESMMLLTKDLPVEVRFIELMPVGEFGNKGLDKVVLNSDIIASHPELIKCERTETGSPASYYRIDGYKGRIGFISPMSHKFCDCCNRIRLTCDGRIKPCLGSNGEVDITKVLRSETDKLFDYLKQIIYNKPEGHNFNKGFRSERNMSMIGG